MPLKLLVVDDSKPIRDSLRGLLARIAGIASVAEAETLAQALQSVRFAKPALVILDLHLPDGLATQIIGTLKQISPTLRIAVFTIHADDGYRTQCLALGADWFFDKTTEFENLLDVVRQQVALN
jgi:DNA-binding NarL/FixJ family response regulator